MVNVMAISVAVIASSLSAFAAVAAAEPIDFGIDCMIHSDQGKLLADLGMVGSMMQGEYMGDGVFTYNDLKIEANLNGPFTEVPEVASPQIKLSVSDAAGKILASVVTTANPEINAALLIPTENLYLHCEKMNMTH